jgi:ubiquinone/menaquinone biosynthesis C-methylase UbiE
LPSKSFRNYLEVNKRHWNAIAERDRPKKADMLKQIGEKSAYLEKWEPKLSPYLRHIRGKRIIVPQFGDGLVMLACAKKGAIVTGVDLSDEQVRLARKTAEYCGVKIALVEADWQDLPENIPNNHFDMVVTECGIFIWIRKLEGWMKNAYKVLKNGGMLVVSDFHPLSIITESKNEKVAFRKSYFDQEPEVCIEEPDVPPSIEFVWKLSDVINSAIQAGFRVNRLEEFYVDEPKGIPLIPNNFLLVARKE